MAAAAAERKRWSGSGSGSSGGGRRPLLSYRRRPRSQAAAASTTALTLSRRRVTNLGRNQLDVVCVYARRRCVAAIALPPSHCRRCVAAIALPPSRRRPYRCHPHCCHRHRLINAMFKKYARVGCWREDGRQQNKQQWLWLRLQYTQNCKYDDVSRTQPLPLRRWLGRE